MEAPGSLTPSFVRTGKRAPSVLRPKSGSEPGTKGDFGNGVFGDEVPGDDVAEGLILGERHRRRRRCLPRAEDRRGSVAAKFTSAWNELPSMSFRKTPLSRRFINSVRLGSAAAGHVSAVAVWTGPGI